MRARRRDREHVSGNGDGNRQRNQSNGSGGKNGSSKGGGGKGGGGKGRNRNRRRNRNRGGGNKGNQAPSGAGFWGEADKLPAPVQDVRITDDPAAVARSLGSPPLPGHEKIAEHYFTVVYERAVQTAGALAAAGGLIDPMALAGESFDD
jgi:hypothetical protein